MRILVVDGQGGGLGKSIIEALLPELRPDDGLTALGTNALATAAMIKAGAPRGASGENAIVHNAAKADVIIGALGIIVPNAMLGELTPAMAQAIASSEAEKILIPLNRCGVWVVGVERDMTALRLVQEAVACVAGLRHREP